VYYSVYYTSDTTVTLWKYYEDKSLIWYIFVGLFDIVYIHTLGVDCNVINVFKLITMFKMLNNTINVKWYIKRNLPWFCGLIIYIPTRAFFIPLPRLGDRNYTSWISMMNHGRYTLKPLFCCWRNFVNTIYNILNFMYFYFMIAWTLMAFCTWYRKWANYTVIAFCASRPLIYTAQIHIADVTSGRLFDALFSL
jgi:hypothetical protein